MPAAAVLGVAVALSYSDASALLSVSAHGFLEPWLCYLALGVFLVGSHAARRLVQGVSDL